MPDAVPKYHVSAAVSSVTVTRTAFRNKPNCLEKMKYLERPPTETNPPEIILLRLPYLKTITLQIQKKTKKFSSILRAERAPHQLLKAIRKMCDENFCN